MSGRYWRSLSALGPCVAIGCALFVGSVAAQQPLPDGKAITKAEQPDNGNNSAPSGNDGSAPAQGATPILTGSAPQSVPPQKTATDPEYYLREDLEAQQNVATSTRDIDRAAWWQFTLGIFGTFLLVFTVIYAKRAAEQTRRAADIARDIGEAQVRAYLTCESGRFDLTENSLIAWASLRNAGQSPAREISLRATLSRIPGKPVESNELSFCPPIPAGQTDSGVFVFENLKPQQVDAIRKDLRGFAVKAEVTWVDVFGKQVEPKLVFALMAGTDRTKLLLGEDYKTLVSGEMVAENHYVPNPKPKA